MITTMIVGMGAIGALAGAVSIFDALRLPYWRAVARERAERA